MEGFPDAEDAVCEVLEGIAPTGTAVDEDFAIPIRVNRSGGSSRAWEDNAVVEVTCWAPTRPESKELDRAVRARLNDARAVTTSAGLIDKITNVTGAMQIPDLNPDMRRVVSTWAVVSRLQEIS